MLHKLNLRTLVVLASCALLVSSCKDGKLFGKKKESSDVTGWNYNDKNQGGYQVAREKEQRTGPGLVFVQGGTFTMGSTQEDVMGDWNNIPRRVTVNSFYIDRSEVANVHYREYMYWINTVFDGDEYQAVRNGVLPDTLVWRSELANNEPMVENYFRHPAYNYYPGGRCNLETSQRLLFVEIRPGERAGAGKPGAYQRQIFKKYFRIGS